MALAGRGIDFAWMLHIGIFVVWLPFIVRIKMDNRNSESSDSWITTNRRVSIKHVFRHAPKWAKVIAAAGWGYAFISFFLFSWQKGVADPDLNTWRIFSSGWIGFYGIAAGGLFPEEQKVT